MATKYQVHITKRAIKTVEKMPFEQQELLQQLLLDLSEKGPYQYDWPNYSPLKNQKDRYHCHLSKKWVACWRWEKGTIVIEVYYAGSRQNPPY
jgi:mRNA-degrading endonuclease RelE of RelBE toxin-antitoxin system